MNPFHLAARSLFTVFIGLLLGLTSLAQAESQTHPASGMVFPDNIGAFQRISVKHFEPQNPGLGSAYGYRSGVGTTATVYVYTAGLSNIPPTVDHPVMAKLREQTIGEIKQFAQSKGTSVNHTLTGTIPIKIDNGKDVRVLFDGFDLLYPDGKVDTQVWLWTARGHIMKIRMTKNADADQTIAFAKAVVGLSVK